MKKALMALIIVLFGYGVIKFVQADTGGVTCPGQGGTGTATAFTAGSVVFASGASAGCGQTGQYTQDNASFYWDDSNNKLGLNNTSPAGQLHISGLNASTTGQVIDSAASATADLQTWKVNGTTVAAISSNGGFTPRMVRLAQVDTLVPQKIGETILIVNYGAYAGDPNTGNIPIPCVSTGIAAAQWAVLGGTHGVNMNGCGSLK